MYWLAPENFLLILAIVLILVGAFAQISFLLIAGAALFVLLVLFTIFGMSIRRKKNKKQK